MKNYKYVEDIYKEIKRFVELPESKEKDAMFDLYLQENGELELWVKTDNFADILVNDTEVTQKEYEQLCYKIYKHRLNVYTHE